MTVTPTWDLFIIVFFGLVITYSFIIGKHEAVKIIISTYISILAVEGIGNVIERLTGDSRPLLSVLGLNVIDTKINELHHEIISRHLVHVFFFNRESCFALEYEL